MVLKGISPLIATVLLIGVTMAIAGLLAVFGQNLVSEKLQQSLKEPIAGDCGFGNFVVDACSYNPTSQQMTFILNNIGTVDLSNITVYATYPDNTLASQTVTGSLPSGSLASFSAVGITAGFNRITVRTQCTNVYEETKCS